MTEKTQDPKETNFPHLIRRAWGVWNSSTKAWQKLQSTKTVEWQDPGKEKRSGTCCWRKICAILILSYFNVFTQKYILCSPLRVTITCQLPSKSFIQDPQSTRLRNIMGSRIHPNQDSLSRSGEDQQRNMFFFAAVDWLTSPKKRV